MLFQKQKYFLAALIFSLGLFSFAAPYVAEARGLVPCGGYQENGQPEPACKFTDIFVLFARVTNWLIGVAGMFAIYQIINAGFWLVLSQGNEEAISTQKKAITSAVVGLVLVFMSFMLINFVINGILANGKPGFKLDLTNPVCYLSPTTQNECFVPAAKSP